MTDEEIEKSLYACGIEAKCNDCLYIENCNKASNLVKDALAYINRLKVECESKENCTIEQHAEIHRLRDEVKQVHKDTAKDILQEIEMRSVCKLKDDGYKEYTISELALNEISDKFVSLVVDDNV